MNTTIDMWPIRSGWCWEVTIHAGEISRRTTFYTHGWRKTKTGARLAIWTEIRSWKRAIKRAMKETF